MEVDARRPVIDSSDLGAYPPPHEVVELVEQTLGGDKRAREIFYRSFEPIIKRQVQKWMDRERHGGASRLFSAEDYCQETMMRIIYGVRKGKEYTDHASPLKNWLDFEGPRRMSLLRYINWQTVHYMRDLIRTEIANNSDEQEEYISDTDHQTPETLTSEERLQLRSCSRKCWQNLPPSYRETMERVGLMGYSQHETAKQLKVAESTISRWLDKATQSFRSCLENTCPEELLPFRTDRP
jgi:RNA polymerase sigma factor (sigma-70 family)